MSFIFKITALLIGLVFLGATAQCTAVCVQSDAAAKHVPPCHQKHTSCQKQLLTSERAVASAATVPALTVLPFTFVPAVLVDEALRSSKLTSSAHLTSHCTTVLLI